MFIGGDYITTMIGAILKVARMVEDGRISYKRSKQLLRMAQLIFNDKHFLI